MKSLLTNTMPFVRLLNVRNLPIKAGGEAGYLLSILIGMMPLNIVIGGVKKKDFKRFIGSIKAKKTQIIGIVIFMKKRNGLFQLIGMPMATVFQRRRNGNMQHGKKVKELDLETGGMLLTLKK